MAWFHTHPAEWLIKFASRLILLTILHPAMFRKDTLRPLLVAVRVEPTRSSTGRKAEPLNRPSQGTYSMGHSETVSQFTYEDIIGSPREAWAERTPSTCTGPGLGIEHTTL